MLNSAMRRTLYKYFSERKWAEAFLDGNILFRSLAYFRDFEDQQVRGDLNEGSAIYRPDGGLVITNHTQGWTRTFLDHAFESSAKQEDIFVFCLSRSFSDEIQKKFAARFSVEVMNIASFCRRVVAALPTNATFPGAIGHTRIGNNVEYYDPTEGGSPLWALPDKIAISKGNAYAWQNEFRLVFSFTDALGFERVDTRLISSGNKKVPNPAEHHEYAVKAQSLRDICRLHVFPS
jgi:hypothetical protein